MIIKIIVEAAFDESIFAHAEEVPFRVVPAAHIMGYLGAIAAIVLTCPVYFLQKQNNKKQV